LRNFLTFNSRKSAAIRRQQPPKSLLQHKTWAIVIFFFLCLFFGLLCGVNAWAAIGLIVIPIIVLFFYNPLYAFYLFVASLPLYVIPLHGVEGVNASIPRLLGILLVIVWGPYVFFTRKFKLIKWDPFLVMIIIFFGWMFISASWSHLPPKGWIMLRAIAQLIFSVFIALTLVDNRNKLSIMVSIILVTCMFAGFRSFSLSLYLEERAVGIEGFDQNEFASMLLTPMMIALALYGYHYVKSKFWALAHLIVAFGCFLGALATVSRGFVLSVIAACIALIAITPDRKKLAVLLIIAFLITSPYYMKKYSDRMGNEQFEITSSADVPRGRLGIWLIGWEVFKNYPIAGVGIGGFPQAFDDELKKDPTRIHFWEYGRVAHNDYLLIVCELGIIGLLLWFGVVYQVFKKGFRTLVILERTEDKYFAAVQRGIIAGFVGLLTASFFLGVYHTKFMWLELMLFALLANVSRLNKEKSSDKELKSLPDP